MSEPKRYHHFIKFYSKSFTDVTGARYCYPDAGMTEDKDGKYVEYEDYARLKAEVERLKLEVFAFDRTIKQASCHYDNRLEDIRQLQAQVERLTKAGDWLVVAVQTDDCWESWDKGIAKWNAAKEGKPHA